MNTKIALTLITILFFNTSYALVDMKNANFSDYWLDIVSTPAQGGLKIDRTYNSRSLFSGIFGFGWCSPIENSLSINLEGSLTLKQCNKVDVTFYPKENNKIRLTNFVNRVVTLYKKIHKNVSKKRLDNIKTDLLNDAKSRSLYASEVGLSIPYYKGLKFYRKSDHSSYLTFNGENFIFKENKKRTLKFNKLGQLIFARFKDGYSYSIGYLNKKINYLSNSKGAKFSFFYYPGGKVNRITGSNSLSTEYKFKGEDLISVKNAWGNTYSYAYDDYHNILRLNFPDGSHKALTYNEQKDWVTSFKDRNNCVEKFKFTLSRKTPKDHYWSESSKKCNTKLEDSSKFEFWYARRSDKNKFLKRVLSRVNDENTDIFYHKFLGQPILIKSGKLKTEFDYFKSGLRKNKTLHSKNISYKTDYDYDSRSRVDRTKYAVNKKKLRNSKYSYDNFNRVETALINKKEKLNLSYNKDGLISNIKSSKSEEIAISYSNRMPASISSPNLGKIEFIYDEAGNVKNLKDTNGKTSAIRISDIFSRFFDILEPVTEELNFL